jgi:hypothetical protein
VISRQKLVGWVLVVVSGFYIGRFFHDRLLVAGPPIEKKEWVQLIFSVVIFMLGTANVRLAAKRERRDQGSND